MGVVHRDCSPQNILIGIDGCTRITDFGIAALVADAGTSGGLAGTPAYMAPELFGGEQPSVRSDLYSLGMVLYELMTGKPPFAGFEIDQENTDRNFRAGTTGIRPFSDQPGSGRVSFLGAQRRTE